MQITRHLNTVWFWFTWSMHLYITVIEIDHLVGTRMFWSLQKHFKFTIQMDALHPLALIHQNFFFIWQETRPLVWFQTNSCTWPRTWSVQQSILMFLCNLLLIPLRSCSKKVHESDPERSTDTIRCGSAVQGCWSYSRYRATFPCCSSRGWNFVLPPFAPVLPPGSLSAMRFVTAVQEQEKGGDKLVEQLSRELWTRIWSEDKDITEAASLAEVPAGRSRLVVFGELNTRRLSVCVLRQPRKRDCLTARLKTRWRWPPRRRSKTSSKAPHRRLWTTGSVVQQTL